MKHERLTESDVNAAFKYVDSHFSVKKTLDDNHNYYIKYRGNTFATLFYDDEWGYVLQFDFITIPANHYGTDLLMMLVKGMRAATNEKETA